MKNDGVGETQLLRHSSEVGDSEGTAISVLSLHWGFSVGGVGKYATLIESVGSYAPVQFKSVCILSNDWQTDQINLEQIDIEKIHIRSRLDTSWIFKISPVIRQFNPDVIMTHGFNGHFVAFIVRIIYKKIPVVSSYHGLYHATTFARRFFGVFVNPLTDFFLHRVAMDIVCVADYTKEYLCGRGINPDKLTVVHNGIECREPDVSKRSELRNEWGVEDDELLLGVVSRFDPFKGLEYAIDAMRLVIENVPQIKMVLVGSGTLGRQLKEQVENAGLNSRVIFTGLRTDIDQCLGAIDIFIFPSLSEAHSIALLEAMRAGKPIIATDVGGNTESVRHMKEAVIVPAQSAASLAEAMQTLAEDEQLRQKSGENARSRFIEEFTVDIMVKKTAEWLVNCGEKIKINKDKMQ